MADTFGLAVNILTVLELGRKFAILAWNIYEDGKDGVPRVSSLDFTSKDLAGVARKLGAPGSFPAAHRPDQSDEPIRQLAKRCAKVVAEMQGTISEISAHNSDRKIRKAMVQAFRYKWKQDEIEAFQKEIEDLRSELMLNLSIGLRNGMTMSLENQDAMVKELADSQDRDQGLKERLDNLARQQERFVQMMVEILSSIATPAISSSDHNRLQVPMGTDLLDAMNNSPEGMAFEDSTRLQISPHRLTSIRRQFISIFRYDSMSYRETGVAEAHEVTLKWIFDQPSGEAPSWHNFSKWLESDNQLYWITGKMGSGKSTLMKYISQELPTTGTAGTERRCTPYLLRCAKDKPVFIATFYFWAGSNDSTRLQTSTEGLYRTILTQILEAYPEAAPCVSPRRWGNLCLFNKDFEPPGATELESMLTNAVNYVSSVAKVCLFIDGLDEFGGGKNDLKGLVDWVKRLPQTLPVKLCVASRPWRVFEDALQDRPHLLMESFNSKDIHRYVSTSFLEDPHFLARKQIEPALCDELVKEIVFKAEGVFLWVNLVCTSLLEAMSEGDLMGRLKQILKELPVEMENLFDHILDKLDLSLKDHVAQYFFLMQACRRTPDALIFSFADDIREDIDFAIKIPERSLTHAESQFGNRNRPILSPKRQGLFDDEEHPGEAHCYVEGAIRSAPQTLLVNFGVVEMVRESLFEG
ncbi:hypothetical protein Daus18300_013444 [Diaporthe australafricana]|uniref:Nephrocystin 3-like N-terminal domain-containing protein n=1 Tax=Diaporthe australafricana TaxID=127596 RepID=A0ABR3VZ37_9PEZI